MPDAIGTGRVGCLADAMSILLEDVGSGAIPRIAASNEVKFSSTERYERRSFPAESVCRVGTHLLVVRVDIGLPYGSAGRQSRTLIEVIEQKHLSFQ